MPKVYWFHQYDINDDVNVRSKRMATRECIARVGGVPVEASEQEVPNFALDSDGFYDPGE